MTVRAKTIQIFLPSGDPQGVRIAEITTRILQVIEVPRKLIGEIAAMPESNHVALYFLIGDSEDAEPHVYVGQTGDIHGRLAAHHREKDFWERALIVISKTNSLTQTHATFLEWYCLTACREAGRYADENGNSASKPHTPAPLEADCLEIFDTTKTLLSTLGYPVFDTVTQSDSESGTDELYYCKAAGTDGRGQYTNEGFVVLKGSVSIAENQREMAPRYERMRQSLVTSGIAEEREEGLVFVKDHLFNSPSAAATAILGRQANGWRVWKDAGGRTLDELKRK